MIFRIFGICIMTDQERCSIAGRAYTRGQNDLNDHIDYRNRKIAAADKVMKAIDSGNMSKLYINRNAYKRVK